MVDLLRAFCVGHRPPLFQPRLEFTMVCPAPLGIPGELVIADGSYSRNEDGVLSEYAQLFGLAQQLAAGDVCADHLYLFQYRKFVALREGPRRSTNMPYAFVADGVEAAALSPSMQDLRALSARLLIGPGVKFQGSVARHYAHFHVLEDFVALVAACASLQTLTPPRLSAFLSSDLLLPSPALCLIEVGAFVQLMQALERVWSEFAAHYYVKRDGYQRRVGGFLLERLHSFLLLEWIAAERATPASGHQIIVSDSVEVTPT